MAKATLAFKPIGNSPSDGTDNEVYAVSNSWDINSVNWTNRNSSDVWDNQGGMSESETMMFGAGGGDFDASTKVVEKQDGDWETYDVTSIVQGYLDGSRENNGFILMGGFGLESFTSGMNYASSDASDASSRPKLTIEFGDTPILAMNSRLKQSALTLSVSQNSLDFSVAAQGNFKVSVVNAQGREMYSSNVLGAQNNVIATDAFSSGVYFMKVSGNKLTTVEKFVIR